jgi:hypothetical protein
VASDRNRIEVDGDGKEKRAISVSGYVYQAQANYTDEAFRKTIMHKGKARNYLVEQVERFRVGDKDSRREDDLLDTFCYGIPISLGNASGFLRATRDFPRTFRTCALLTAFGNAADNTKPRNERPGFIGSPRRRLQAASPRPNLRRWKPRPLRCREKRGHDNEPNMNRRMKL